MTIVLNTMNTEWKNKNANIILFEETDTSYSNDDSLITEHDDGNITIEIKMQPCKDVKDLYYKTSTYHNVIITNPIFDGTAMVGFKHPITNQQFIKTSDFYERQKYVIQCIKRKDLITLISKTNHGFKYLFCCLNITI